MKSLLGFIIIIRIIIPMGLEKTFHNVKWYKAYEGFYIFETLEGTTIHSPAAFTIVEEK